MTSDFGVTAGHVEYSNYKYTSDFDKRNELDLERFLSHRLRLKADAVCEVYEANPSDTTA